MYAIRKDIFLCVWIHANVLSSSQPDKKKINFFMNGLFLLTDLIHETKKKKKKKKKISTL